MFHPLDELDKRAHEAKERAELKAATEILVFENENQRLAIEQTLNRPFRPLADLPAEVQTHDEGSWLNSKHNPKN